MVLYFKRDMCYLTDALESIVLVNICEYWTLNICQPRIFFINLVCFITLPPRVSKTLEDPSGNQWYVESSQGTLQWLSCRNRVPRGTARHSHSGQFGAEADWPVKGTISQLKI